MLSIGKLTTGANSERYYTQNVAKGREDYYAGHGEAPGRWAGSGWDTGESDRPVTEQELRNVLTGKHPDTGIELRDMNARSVAGFDLTFSAPKSVSVLFAIGDPDVIAAARDAHDHAVRESLGYLERHACKTRVRRDGQIQVVDGDGFIAATFRHRTSRAGDPQLHTHVVVGNITKSVAGGWTALDARHLYRHAKTAGYLYQAALRAQLTARLGVTFGAVGNGAAEIAGVPAEVIDEFSQRRRETLEQMRVRGEHSRGAAHTAALETRKRKDYEVPADRLRDEWRARAAEHGLTTNGIAELLNRETLTRPSGTETARRAADLAGPHGLTRNASTFDRRAVIRGWAERHRQGATVADVERLSDTWLGSAHAVPLRTQRPGPEPVYTTPEMLDTERHLVDAATRARDTHRGIAAEDHVETAIARRPSIAPEQADMVRALTRSGHGVEVVRAAAGTGKTFALDAAREAWEASGRKVVGCAIAARAAAELREQTAMPTTTVSRLTNELDHGYGLAPHSVLVVDEAAMVGTRSLAKLADYAEAADAKLVLVGDDRQLPEIEAGGAFRALAERTDAISLHEVRRQAHQWDRDALSHLRGGRAEEWLDAYRAHDRLRGAHDADHTRALLVDDWHTAIHEQPDHDSLMIAHRRSDVADLNQRARARLQSAGRLGPDAFEIDGRHFAVGDRITTTANERRLDITNGTRATITAIDPDTRDTTIKLDDDTEITLPASYIDAGNLDHGYATTAHRAQGATVDHSFVLGSDDLYREWGYTALTRHRESATFYVNLGDAQDELPGIDISPRPQQEITATLSRSQRQTIATDRGIPEPPAAPPAFDLGR